MKSGKRFGLRALHNPFADANVRALPVVRQALAPLGIDVVMQNRDFPGYVKAVYTERAIDIEIEDLGNAFDPTLGAERVYWSNNFKIGLGLSNGAHHVNPEVDRLLEAASIEVDPARRRDQFVQFQQIIRNELPVLNLLSSDSYLVARKPVRDHTLTIDGPRANFAEVHSG